MSKNSSENVANKGDLERINLSTKSNLSKMDFSPEQEKTIRSLIADLKMYLNGFKQSFEHNQRKLKADEIKEQAAPKVAAIEDCEHIQEITQVAECESTVCQCNDYIDQESKNDLMSECK
tara:strand:+ start:1439 stop:1798 length:360 start_codon:yes stop_codon:yes gene_type:complete